MQTWVVIYTLNTGKVYGWFCKAKSVSEAEQEFWKVMEEVPWMTIRCICDLQSNVIDAYFSLYERAGDA